MSKGDRFWTMKAQRKAMGQAEADGRVVDSMEVRNRLMGRVKAGEITLEEAQTELKRIKRGAKKRGMVTRNQAYRGKK